MRDLVPRKSPIKKNFVTPWSTYIHVTPIKLPKRPSLSPSPVAHSKSPIVMSPIALSPTIRRPVVEEESSCTPSIAEYPHESTQLPRRPRAMKKARPAIDVIEEFIKDLPPQDKEGVRMTYNGPDWPGYLERLFQRGGQPRLSLVPDITRQSIATSYGGHNNRFLVGLPSLTPPPVHVPQVVYHYFPRGC